MRGSGEGGSRTGDSQHRYRANMPRPGMKPGAPPPVSTRSGTSSSTHPAIPCRSTHGHSTHGSDRRIAGYGRTMSSRALRYRTCCCAWLLPQGAGVTRASSPSSPDSEEAPAHAQARVRRLGETAESNGSSGTAFGLVYCWSITRCSRGRTAQPSTCRRHARSPIAP